jgi:hypothetical protein
MQIMLSIILAALASTVAAGPANWHENAFFGLHYDLHPNVKDTELGRETTYEHIREQLEKAKPDYVQYDCKGHPGYAGYPTKVGSPSPGIVNDALKVWRQVTRDMGIPLSIHYSGVWDTRAIELHPDWARVDAEGKPSPNNTCPTSGYTDELMIPQLLEVVENYDIDGVWIDGENWASQPCFCPRCAAEFMKRTGIEETPKKKDDPNWDKYLAFQRDLFTEHVTKYAKALHEKKPTLTVVSNWMYSVREPEPIVAPVDALSGDFDPSFGAARACAEARFLSSRGLPWDLMAWSFLQTGDQGWTSKPAVHLCQEVAEVLAQGGAVFIYDQPQRSGRLTSWHQDVLGDVGRFCQKRKAYSHKTQTIPQVAVLHSESYYYRHNDPLFNFAKANQPMEGALHAVLENGYSADILNEEMFIERGAQYPVVIVPEEDGLPDNVKAALKSYVEQGGRLILSGTTVAAEFPELTGVEVVEGQQGGWIPADGGAVTLGAPWQQVKPGKAEELAALLSQQDPELNKTGFSAATRLRVGQGTVVAVHGPVFQEYYRSHYPRLRVFVGEMIAALDTPKLMHVDGPWWVEMAARQKDGRTLIQLVNRSASGYLAPDRHVVEHVPDAGPFTLRIPMEKAPARCYLAPDEAGLEWTWKDGVLTAKIAGLGIHNVLVIE